VALAFLIRQPGLFAIPKTARAERAEENAGAADLVLSAEDVAAIDKALPRGKAPRGLPMI
jgi:diketogulonate reductase-like aldo/keto reductase